MFFLATSLIGWWISTAEDNAMFSGSDIADFGGFQGMQALHFFTAICLLLGLGLLILGIVLAVRSRRRRLAKIEQAAEGIVAVTSQTGLAGEIERLNALRLAGALSPEEYQSAKAKLLD